MAVGGGDSYAVVSRDLQGFPPQYRERARERDNEREREREKERERERNL